MTREWKDTWACGKGAVPGRVKEHVYAHFSVAEPRPARRTGGMANSQDNACWPGPHGRFPNRRGNRRRHMLRLLDFDSRDRQHDRNRLVWKCHHGYDDGIVLVEWTEGVGRMLLVVHLPYTYMSHIRIDTEEESRDCIFTFDIAMVSGTVRITLRASGATICITEL